MSGNRRWTATCLLGIVLVLGTAFAGAVGPAATEPVSARLVADAGAIRAGEAFLLGVRLRLADGWHVYWKNAGASGLPTEVRLRLPEGFAAGPLLWPLPVRFHQPGGEESYGYEREVLLAARIQPPSDLQEKDVFEFGAECRWLACRELCRLGRAELRLALPVSAERVKGDGGFDDWLAALPAGPREAHHWVGAHLEGRLSPAGESGHFEVALQWKRPPRSVDWYPASPGSLEVADIRLAGEGTQWRLHFTARTLTGQHWEGDTLESLLVFVDADGRRRGVELPLRLRKGAPAEPSAR